MYFFSAYRMIFLNERNFSHVIGCAPIKIIGCLNSTHFMSLFALVRTPKKCEQKCEYSHYSFALAPEVRTIVCTPILCANGNPNSHTYIELNRHFKVSSNISLIQILGKNVYTTKFKLGILLLLILTISVFQYSV